MHTTVVISTAIFQFHWSFCTCYNLYYTHSSILSCLGAKSYLHKYGTTFSHHFWIVESVRVETLDISMIIPFVVGRSLNIFTKLVNSQHQWFGHLSHVHDMICIKSGASFVSYSTKFLFIPFFNPSSLQVTCLMTYLHSCI